MRPISELVRVARSCDTDWHCPLGDAAADAFGREAAVFIRSSANHVFRSDDAVLRVRPVTDAESADATSRWARRLADAGGSIAPPLLSPRDRLVETVEWEGTAWCVTAWEYRIGASYDSGELTAERAWEWGVALAQLHEAGESVEPMAPAPADTVVVSSLPRKPGVFGMLHGDPEPDNLIDAASRDGLVFVDLDDAGPGWFVSDVSFALRDWAPPASAPDLEHPVVAGFLAGYRTQRSLTEVELSCLPAFARWHAERTLHRLTPVLAETPDPAWPDWAKELSRKVHDTAAELAAAVGR